MFVKLFIFTCLAAVVSHSHAKTGFGPGGQDWGYVDVRENAQMFWWLYFTTAKVNSFYDRPLIVWLQGGPGGSSTGFGNFELIGPLNIDLQRREYNWVDHFNVLFVDSPIGTGFSFAKNNAFAKTDKQAANDLLTCIKAIYKIHPNLRIVPVYIVGESYGGKIAVEFAKVWHEAEKKEKMKSNLKGVAMGDAWISPVDSVMSWAPYLLHTGMIDNQGYEMISRAAMDTKKAITSGNWRLATDLWRKTEVMVEIVTHNVDFYNILSKISFHNDVTQDVMFKNFRSEDLKTLMNTEVKTKLNLSTTWGAQSNEVFDSHSGDFMKPAIEQVEWLLNNTNLNVFVYNGQLDLIVDTPGTMNWINKLRWKYAKKWQDTEKEPVTVDYIIEGYIKQYKKFAMYWINRSGHMVPKDNPAVALKMMEDFTRGDSKNCLECRIS